MNGEKPRGMFTPRNAFGVLSLWNEESKTSIRPCAKSDAEQLRAVRCRDHGQAGVGGARRGRDHDAWSRGRQVPRGDRAAEAGEDEPGRTAAEALDTTKSVVEFETWPVGGPPGMLTTSGTIAFGVAGGAPENSVAVLVPLFDVQSGLVGRNDMPHGLTRFGSVSVAIPGMSETTFDWTTRVPPPGPSRCSDRATPRPPAPSPPTPRRRTRRPPRRFVVRARCLLDSGGTSLAPHHWRTRETHSRRSPTRRLESGQPCRPSRS